MGSLIRHITGLASAGYGVNVWEVAPVQSIRGDASAVLGMVAELPWGPVDSVTTITTPAEFWSYFYPNVFSGGTKDYTTYPAVLAMLNKPCFPSGGLKVVRVGATSQAKSTLSKAAGTGTMVVTAKYYGAVGDEISIQWVAATGGDADERDLLITIGSDYSARYQDIAYTDDVSETIDDPYVDVESSSPTAMPTAMGSAESLASGSDGTAVAADYVGSDSSTKGIRCFYSESVDCDVLFVAEAPSGILDDINDGLEAYAGDTDKGVVVLCTTDDQASADAITYVADYRDDRIIYAWPRVKTTNWWSTASDKEVEVDGNAFAAALIANVDPWLSPGGNGARQGTTDLLSGITGLEDESGSRTTLDLLNAAGVAPWFVSSRLGAMMRRAVTTTLTGRTKLHSRRMTDYLVSAIAEAAEEIVERPLDLDLSAQALGTVTGQFVGSVKSFLQREVDAEHIRSFSVDPWTANAQADIDAGQWTVLIRVKLMSMAEEIILKADIGETVQVDG